MGTKQQVLLIFKTLVHNLKNIKWDLGFLNHCWFQIETSNDYMPKYAEIIRILNISMPS